MPGLLGREFSSDVLLSVTMGEKAALRPHIRASSTKAHQGSSMGHEEPACNHGWFECNSRKVVMSICTYPGLPRPNPGLVSIVAEGMGGRKFLLDRLKIASKNGVTPTKPLRAPTRPLPSRPASRPSKPSTSTTTTRSFACSRTTTSPGSGTPSNSIPSAGSGISSTPGLTPAPLCTTSANPSSFAPFPTAT